GVHGAGRPAGPHAYRARGGARRHRHGPHRRTVLPVAAEAVAARRRRGGGGSVNASPTAGRPAAPRPGSRRAGAPEAERVVAGYPVPPGQARRAALAGVGLRLSPGAFVGLIGPTGSGKTTLLRLLTRQLAPDSGSVLLGGRPLASFGRFELARHVAVVAQEPEVPVGFTVRETVAMGRAPHVGLLGSSGPEDDRAVEAALASTGTLALAERRIESLSGGERQRAVFARAVAQRP